MDQRRDGRARRLRVRGLAVLVALCTVAVMMPGFGMQAFAASGKNSANNKLGAAYTSDAAESSGAGGNSAAEYREMSGGWNRAVMKRVVPKQASEKEAKNLIRRAVKSPRAAVLEKGQLTTGSKADYYYSKLSSKRRTLYNALLTLAQDPLSGDMVHYATTSSKTKDGFSYMDWFLAYNALIYDHAELFWMWLDGAATDPNNLTVVTSTKSDNGDNGYDWNITLDLKAAAKKTTNPQEKPDLMFTDEAGYKSTMAEFNDAAADFLADIDRNHSDAVVAMEIHDKLCKEIDYDKSAATSTASYFNPAHTAYGALVNKKAVCDGYALAYSYLLKKCGIDSAVVLGYVGDITYGHAWDIVKLDGSWYEVDCTWDDAPGKPGVFYHDFLFVTTKKISTNTMKYDGHSRDDTYPYERLSRLLPKATATHFSPKYMKSCGQTLKANTNPAGKSVTLAAQTSARLFALDQAPYVSDGNWTVRVAVPASAGALTADTSVYTAAPETSSDSLFNAPSWDAGSQSFRLSLADPSDLNAYDLSGSSAVTTKVEFDNGSTAAVSTDLMISARASAASSVYDGSVKVPSLKVTDAAGTPLPGGAYKAVLSANAVSPDLYANLVTFGANPLYTGDSSASGKTLVAWQKISPASPTLSSASLNGRRLTVRWAPAKASETSDAAQALAPGRLQVQLSTSRTFARSKTKTFTVTASTATRLSRKLASATKSGRTLKYARVRTVTTAAYHGISGDAASMARDGRTVTLHSAWSRARALTITVTSRAA